MFKKLTLLILLLIVSIVSVQAQSRTVSGRVLDEKGVAVAGASVQLKGSASGTITNAEGRFSIEVPSSNSVLQVSSLNMETKEIPVGNQQSLNITLSSN